MVDDPDELDTAEIALEDEPDKLGKGRALVLGLKGMIALWVEDGYLEHVGSRVPQADEMVTRSKREE